MYIHMIEDDESDKDDQCEQCKYNTNDYVCHPHCSGCDGKSKFVSGKPLGQKLTDGLRALKAEMANATALVDEMCAIVDALKAERRGINVNNSNNND